MTGPAKGLPGRILVLSATGIGSHSATGQLMQKLFAPWARKDLLSLYHAPPPKRSINSLRVPFHRDEAASRNLIERCREFNPDGIYYRPVDNPPDFHHLAVKIIDELRVPYAIHMMDDWPTRLKATKPELFKDLNPTLNRLIRGAEHCMSICDAMSAAYQQRYQRPFTAIANGVSTAEVKPLRDPPVPFKVLYSGALAGDMTFQSLDDIAQAVSELSATHRISLEIRTMPWFMEAARRIAQRPAVQALGLASERRYPKIMNRAGCVVIGYNFDAESARYVRYSLANKLPECLACGSPLLVYGPRGLATIDVVAERELGICITRRSIEDLKRALLRLMRDASYGRRYVRTAQQAARTQFNIEQTRQRFVEALDFRSANLKNTTSTAEMIAGPHSQNDGAHIDETKIVSELVGDQSSGIMIDVGAHHGSAFLPFHKKGWIVHAFEPDPKNRKYIEDRYSKLERFQLDNRAVSDADGRRVPFYSSEESTGISGLSAFRDSHEVECEVTTVTLRSYLKTLKDRDPIDFLKIDTEGFDLMVLKGFPWDEDRPAIVECEFEDNKTVPLGYTFDDIASFLHDKGYHVYVSEWHPIVRYGIKHQWNRMFKYPGKLVNEQSWGNLLAFRADPDRAALQAAVQTCLSKKKKTVPAQSAGSTELAPAATRAPTAPPFTSTKSAEQPSRGSKQVSKPFSRMVAYRQMFKDFYTSAPGMVTLGVLAGAIVIACGTALLPPDWSVPAFVILSTPLWLLLSAYLYSRAVFVAEQAKLVPFSQPDRAGQNSSEALTEARAAKKLVEQRALQVLAEVDETMKRLQDNTAKVESLEEALSQLEEDFSAVDLRSTEAQRDARKMLSEFGEMTEEIPGFLERLIDLRSRVLRLESLNEEEQARV